MKRDTWKYFSLNGMLKLIEAKDFKFGKETFVVLKQLKSFETEYEKIHKWIGVIKYKLLDISYFEVEENIILSCWPSVINLNQDEKAIDAQKIRRKQ
jgi:ABC-type molybdenum transport system ATPase subunit/photorepair protein PhrA